MWIQLFMSMQHSVSVLRKTFFSFLGKCTLLTLVLSLFCILIILAENGGGATTGTSARRKDGHKLNYTLFKQYFEQLQ